MLKKLVLAVLATCLVLVLCLGVACATAPFNMQATLDQYLSNLSDGWGAIAPAALNDQLATSKPFLVDVREASEMASGGYIQGTINIPIRSFAKNLDKLPGQNKPIVITCGSGHRSALAMEALQLLGYTNVKSLASGIPAWKAANFPVATGAPPAPQAGTAPNVDKDLLAALDNYFSTLPDGWNMMAPAALNEMLKTTKPFQLDVREKTEIAESGSISGATSIPIRTLVKNLDKLPPDKSALIVAEDATGHRSAMIMMALSLLGYKDVKSLAGGVAAWTKAGLPATK